MLQTRELPPAEWPRLAGTEAGDVLSRVRPNSVRVVVVEDEQGVIVGMWTAMTFVHAEGMWIAPAYRRHGGVMRRLLGRMRLVARELGVGGMLTVAMDDHVRDIVHRLGGTRMPGDAYLLPTTFRREGV